MATVRGAAAMSRPDEPIRPMTLGNMRQNGVRGLDVTCLHCGYHTAVNVDAHPDHVTVPSFGPRMRCTKCDKLGAYGNSELDRAAG
jgi:hypothetical protein